MINRVHYLVFVGLLGLLSACSSTPTELTVEEEEWVYEVRAINLVIRAASDVNSVSGRPHSIAIGIFQMNDPNTFSGLAVTREGAVERRVATRIGHCSAGSLVRWPVADRRSHQGKRYKEFPH